MRILGKLVVMGLVLHMLGYGARAEKVLVDEAVLENLIKRQNALEEKVRRLEDRLKQSRQMETPAPDAKPASEADDYLSEEVEEIGERLDKVETKSILDKIVFGGTLAVRMDNYHYENITDIYGQKRDGDTDENWSTRLRLNLRSDVTDDIKFHSRLSYLKLWGAGNFDESSLNDNNSARIPDAEGNLHVERAYVDYFIPATPVSLTFGRLPSSDGPPYQYKFNTTRKSTWPQLVVDGEADGVIANLALDEWTGLKKSMFRVGYSKPIQNYQQYMGSGLEDMRVLIGAFETEIPGVKDSLFWLSAGRMWDLPPLEDLPEGAPVQITAVPDSLGDLDFYTVHLQFTDLMHTGLDWFGASTWMDIRPAGEGTRLSNGFELGLLGDNLNGNLGQEHHGYAFYTGARYRLPVPMLKFPRLGVEYNYGSEFWAPLAMQGGREIINKLWVNGDAWEFYYIQPISERHMYLRAGAIFMDHDYYSDYLVYGTRTESDRSLTSYYFMTEVRF